MKKLLIVAAMLLLGCGNTSVDNELVGQVKKVHHNTPMLCPSYYSADVSLGIMRNGTGSMSTHDMTLVIEGNPLVTLFEEAAANGRPLKVTYHEIRLVLCTEDEVVDKADFTE